MEFRVGVGEWNVSLLKVNVLTQRRRDAECAEMIVGRVGEWWVRWPGGLCRDFYAGFSTSFINHLQ